MDKVGFVCFVCVLFVLFACFVCLVGWFSFIFLEYAQVTRMLGNGRLEAVCFDGQKRLCHIRGKMRKKVWVNQGDVVLLGLRDYQDGKVRILFTFGKPPHFVVSKIIR